MTAQRRSGSVNGRPVWAEVSLSALTHNLHAIRDFVNPKSEKRPTLRKVLCIVKGNGYGHGGPQVAKHLEKVGADWFGVTGAAEGEAVREAGVRKPILALTSFWPGEEDQLLKNKVAPAVIRCEQLAALESAAARRKLAKRSVGIQLKIDTGMNRLGIAPTDIDCFARQYEKCSRLNLQGVFTHFASSEVFAGPVAQQTCDQEEGFHRAIERLRSLGVDPGLIHLANSAAIASRTETWADMVRPGAILYGYHPG
jgi:alanine racemase